MDLQSRRPQQRRSRASLEKLLSAGIELLRESGYEGLSIAEISARSGVSVGSIYQRFANKEALFAGLQERFTAELDQEQEHLFDILDRELSDVELVDTAIDRLARMLHKHEQLLRVMILRGAVDEAARTRGSRSSIVLASSFERFLLASVRRFGHDDPALACDVAFRIVYAAFTRRIMSGPLFESQRDVPWTTFVAELSRCCRAYLLSAADAVCS